MTYPTPSEALFEEFCQAHGLRYTDVPEGNSHTVDYLLHVGGVSIAIEIETLENMRGWNPGGVYTRTVGAHLRRKVADARKQIQAASKAGHPTLLLVHNAVDPSQAFGTEQHDFLAAMYGDYSVRIVNKRITDRYRDRSAALQRGRNTSFSGIGHLSTTPKGPRVHVYENVFARVPLPFDGFPEAIGVSRIEVEFAA